MANKQLKMVIKKDENGNEKLVVEEEKNEEDKPKENN